MQEGKKIYKSPKPYQANVCAYFKKKNCDTCRANMQFSIKLGNFTKIVYCGRLAADLMAGMGAMLTANIDVERIEKLLRVCEQKLGNEQKQFIDD